MSPGGNEAFSRVVIDALLGVVGNQCAGGTPEQISEVIKKESVKWAEVVKRSGAKDDWGVWVPPTSSTPS